MSFARTAGLRPHAQAHREHVHNARRHHAGARRAGRGPQQRLRARRLGVRLLGRRRGRDHAHIHDRPVRSPWSAKTYEIFAAHWPNSEEPAAAPLNNATKYVASTTLKSVEWQNSQLLEGPLADAVNAVKAQDGPEIQVQGSADLIQSLHADGLIDELNVWTFPVILGKGKRLFEPRHPGRRPRGHRLEGHA